MIEIIIVKRQSSLVEVVHIPGKCWDVYQDKKYKFSVGSRKAARDPSSSNTERMLRYACHSLSL